MKIDKLPSGSYRIRHTQQKKTYSVTVKDKPTESEAWTLIFAKIEQDIAQAKQLQTATKSYTFEDAAHDYIDAKSRVLSPSTVRVYGHQLNNLSTCFTSLQLVDITQQDIQLEINKQSATKNWKTVRNYHGFISAVISLYRPNMAINTRLPQKAKYKPYIPSDDDIRAILKEVEGSKYDIPIKLGIFCGLRRSEICALTIDDLEGDILHINKALVQNQNKKWVIKSTKTTAGTRDVVVPPDLAELIRKNGIIFKGYPRTITNCLHRIQDNLGIPRFGLHKTRHYCCSKLLQLGVSKMDLLDMLGWENDTMMMQVYAHALEDKEKSRQREAVGKLISELS